MSAPHAARCRASRGNSSSCATGRVTSRRPPSRGWSWGCASVSTSSSGTAGTARRWARKAAIRTRPACSREVSLVEVQLWGVKSHCSNRSNHLPPGWDYYKLDRLRWVGIWTTHQTKIIMTTKWFLFLTLPKPISQCRWRRWWWLIWDRP